MLGRLIGTLLGLWALDDAPRWCGDVDSDLLMFERACEGPVYLRTLPRPTTEAA